jgi:hypothetical protein
MGNTKLLFVENVRPTMVLLHIRQKTTAQCQRNCSEEERTRYARPELPILWDPWCFLAVERHRPGKAIQPGSYFQKLGVFVLQESRPECKSDHACVARCLVRVYLDGPNRDARSICTSKVLGTSIRSLVCSPTSTRYRPEARQARPLLRPSSCPLSFRAPSPAPYRHAHPRLPGWPWRGPAASSSTV